MAVTLSGATAGGSVVQQAIADPYFPNVICMMPGIGTSGGNNNTFLDSSGNGYTITRNGDATQGSVSPYGNSWSWGSTGATVSVADNAVLRPGTGAFTIEAWIFRNATGSAFTIYSKTFTFSVTSTNVLRFTDGAVTIDSTGTIGALNWFHVAVVREGTGTNQTKLYINGVNDGQGTSSANLNQTTDVTLAQGSNFTSNLRYVSGVAVYLGNFTPSKVPLTAISGTQLLTFQNNRAIDNSPNNFTIVRPVGGGASEETYSFPFGPFNFLAPYDVTTTVGSGYFDGSGDYLSVADAAALRFGTGNFTIQAWVYVTNGPIISKGTATTGWLLEMVAGGTFGTSQLRFVDTTTNITISTLLTRSVWAHVAVVRSGTGANQLKLYVNGVESASATCSTDFNQTNPLYIGANRDAGSTWSGYIANLKYNVGTAETITVPTSPVTGGTLLLNFANAQIVDVRGFSSYLSTNTVSDVQTKWRPTSLYSAENSSTQRISRNNNRFFTNVTGSGRVYTIESWVFPATTGKATTGLTGKWRGDSNAGWYFEITSAGNFAIRGTTYTLSTKFTFNTWQHFAFVNDGTNLTLYLNGQNVWTLACFASGDSDIEGFFVGGRGNDGPTYMQDFRVTIGVARYTANFTPPTAPLPVC